MKTTKQISIIILLLLISCAAKAQQMPVYSQYMMNKFLLNPAVAGSEGYSSFNLTTRKQWIGVKEAPLTFAASAQTRLLKDSWILRRNRVKKSSTTASSPTRVGLGAYIFDDRNGIVGRTGLQLTYAYHIPFQRSLLSFGLSGTIWQFRIRKEDAILLDPDDQFFNNMDNNMVIPDANVGVYYSDERMYAGFSVDQLFQSSLKFGGKGYDQYKTPTHFYLMGAYRFVVSNYVMVEPSLLFKTTQNFIAQLDLSTNVYFYDNYWAGLSFRTGNVMVVMGGVRVDKFYFAYAIDLTFSSVRTHSYGTHEIIIAMKLGDNARRYRWLHRQ